MPETVNYTYDSLNRLSNAAATNGAYSQSYTYDGFGNLTSKSAAGAYPAYSATFNPANNRQNGVAYDANGNQTANSTYDVSNRLVTSTIGQSYAYDYRGKRIVKWMSGSAEVYFYGIDGKKLTTLTCDASLNCSSAAYNVTFAGKLVQSKGYTVATDRLGSVRWSSLGGVTEYIYFPYGEERTGTSNDTEKFGTYTRDSSGQDYADQRYYGVGTGRYWTVDPAGTRAVKLGNPMSWNHYAYALADPINFYDPVGRMSQCADGDDDCDDDPDCGDALSPCSADQDQGGGGTDGGTYESCAADPTTCPAPIVQTTANGCPTGQTLTYNLQGQPTCGDISINSTAQATLGQTSSNLGYVSAPPPSYTQYTVTVGPWFVQGGVSVTVKKTGSVFSGPAGSAGLSPHVSFSVVIGYLPQGTDVDDWAGGWSIGYSHGFLGGYGGQWSRLTNGDSATSVETGLYSPQTGGNGGINICLSGPCMPPPPPPQRLGK